MSYVRAQFWPGERDIHHRNRRSPQFSADLRPTQAQAEVLAVKLKFMDDYESMTCPLLMTMSWPQAADRDSYS